jgi:hypothetical protein
MARNKNHLSTDFITKIRGILYEGAEDTLTPAEFVLYLLETNKNPQTGLVEKITRDDFSKKCGARPHYFSEIYHKEKPADRLPGSIVTALANLTGTNPFFWEGTQYSLKQAQGIHIDMSKNIAPTVRITNAQYKSRINAKSTLTESEKAFLDNLQPFAEKLLIEPQSGEWKHGTFLHDEAGTLTRQGKQFSRLPEFERPHEAIDQVFGRDPNDRHFALKGHFLRALVAEGKKANPDLNINVDRTQSAVKVQPHDTQERYL